MCNVYRRELILFPFIFSYYDSYTAETLYRQFETKNIPRKRLSRLRPNSYNHVSVSGLWEYINRSQTHECGNWDWGCAVWFLGIHKSDPLCCVLPADGPPRSSLTPWISDLLISLTESLPWLLTCWWTSALALVPWLSDLLICHTHFRYHGTYREPCCNMSWLWPDEESPCNDSDLLFSPLQCLWPVDKLPSHECNLVMNLPAMTLTCC